MSTPQEESSPVPVPESAQDIESKPEGIKEESLNDGDPSTNKDAASSNTSVPSKRRRKAPATGKKPTAEALQRRKEGRIKAAATIAQNLKKTGIGRFESENGFGLTSVRSIPLINQKNYYTDYLKKDEQISFIRNWRNEKLLQLKLNNLKKNNSNGNSDKKDDSNSDAKSFDEFNLNDIKAELEKKKIMDSALAIPEDEEEEDDEEEDNEEVTEEKAKQGSDTIVIHPGSSHIRIGRATDAFPTTIPTVVAVQTNEPNNPSSNISPKRTVDEDGEIYFDEAFDEAKAVVAKDFKARMRFYKRRILPNSREGAINFNKKQQPEDIPEHNDPYQKTWISDTGDRKFFVGEDALKLPISEKFNTWKLRFPIVNGGFNESSPDYNSPQEILGDLANIVIESLEKMDIKETKNFKAIIIIPDLYDKMYVETWVDLLFRLVGFGKVAIIQEAVLATFGAGASSACVIDVGSQTTSIACVDEGMVINDSRITLDYGGDNVTEAFIKLLLQSHFPYKEINLNSKNDDWELAETLKQNFVTFQDADIAVQLYNFYKRKPFETTQKYEFKVFDEVMLAPMGLFYPELFEINGSAKSKKLFSPSTDQYSTKPNNPYSRSHENLIKNVVHCDMVDEDLLMSLQEERSSKSTNPFSKPKPSKTAILDHTDNRVTTSLEKAIIESITGAGVATDFGKAKKLYDNLLIVGGGFAKIPGFDLILSDRINIWRPKLLSTSTIDEILDYVTTEKLKQDKLKKQLIEELKESKKTSPDQAIDDIELSEEDLEDIESQTRPQLDWDKLDALSEKGSLLSVNVLPPPREFDPEMLTWKGGSVYGRLKVVSEMWVSNNDWDLLQSRSLYYKSIFNY
ncbi:uncharacterized protein PRCAT00000865001 [Priceomyces carsonii]|uniref:uncharacterized protein n=1 Tax=Priceomyces carsonii TaxID=28549 RepID=UPI002ED8FB41|nr:unnamed protein product [Priceomyces carsonii]